MTSFAANLGFSPFDRSLKDTIQVVVFVNDKLWDMLFICIDDLPESVIIDNFLKPLYSDHRLTRLLTSDYSSGDCIGATKNLELSKIKQPVIKLTSSKYISMLPEECSYLSVSKVTQMNGYQLSYFTNYLECSRNYRHQVVTNHKCSEKNNTMRNVFLPCIGVKLVTSDKDVLDLNWNERIDRMLLERRELDHTMSWFSTLGGAFSALGEEFAYCAEMAGKISVQQMRIALRLGDPLTVARCKLYFALSLMQRNHLKRARKLVETQFHLAKTSSVLDERLVRMCYGVWAKLQYTYKLSIEEKRQKKECSTNNNANLKTLHEGCSTDNDKTECSASIYLNMLENPLTVEIARNYQVNLLSTHKKVKHWIVEMVFKTEEIQI